MSAVTSCCLRAGLSSAVVLPVSRSIESVLRLLEEVAVLLRRRCTPCCRMSCSSPGGANECVGRRRMRRFLALEGFELMGSLQGKTWRLLLLGHSNR